MTNDTFRRQLNKDVKRSLINTSLVLQLSVDSKIQPNNEFIFKTFRRVYIPFGVEVQSIRFDDLVYSSFPKTTNFDLIKIDQCTVDLNLKQAKITGTVSVDFSLEENDYDKLKYFQERVEPLSSHIAKNMDRPDLNLYENEYIANETFKMITMILKNFDLIHSENYNTNRTVRENLINLLVDGDKINVLPNNSIFLEEDKQYDRKPLFIMGTYEYKGAFFKDRQEFETSMKYAEVMGQTEEEIINQKKLDNRYEYMMVILNEQQRIHEITEEEINDSNWVTYAMTENERHDYDLLQHDDSEHAKAARLELARTAKLRWKVANGKI